MNIQEHQKIDEIPFDFSRKVMSVIVETPDGGHRMITKGAPEEVFKRCTHFELDGDIDRIEPVLIQDLKEEYERLSSDGFRVLALVAKTLKRNQRIRKMMRAI